MLRNLLVVVSGALSLSVATSQAASAQFSVVGAPVYGDNFEAGEFSEPLDWRWGTEGGAGFDVNPGFGVFGSANGYVRGSSGWNSIFTKNTTFLDKWFLNCEATVELHGTPNTQNLFLSVLDEGTGRVVSEIGPLNGTQFSGRVVPSCAATRSCQIGEIPMDGWTDWTTIGVNIPREALGRRVYFRVGFWGNGQDAWVRVDNLSVTCFHNAPP